LSTWEPEDVVQLREEITSLRAALQIIRSDHATTLDKQQKSDHEHTAQYQHVCQQLREKGQQYDQLAEKTTTRDAEQSSHIANLDAKLRRYAEAHAQQKDVIQRHELHAQAMQQEVQASRAKVEELEKEREQAIANRLQMDAFDNSVDRVSEAQLVGAMDSILSSVDELVSNLLDDVTELKSQNPEGASRDTTMLEEDTPVLLRAAVLTTPDSEQWGLLLDALLHEKVIGWLHRTLFSTTLGIPPTSGSTGLGQTLEDMYSSVSRNGEQTSNTHIN
jgi:myosin heavy subunit